MARTFIVAFALCMVACAAPEDEATREPSEGDASRVPGLDSGPERAGTAPEPAADAHNRGPEGGDAGASGAGSMGRGDGAMPLAPPDSASDAGVDPSAELYDPQNFPRFDLELPEASLATLNMVQNEKDPRQDSYVSGTLKYGTETVANIGVRLKGEGSFQKLDRKPALKLKFDAFVADQAFRGLRRMTLNNAFEDPSFVAERLAYEVFRAADLPAPRCNNATLYINGTFYGVYVNVEAEDKTFLRRWFASDDGNLYEEGQKDFVAGAETAFNLETNETANDRTDLRKLIAAVQGASSPATFLSDVGAGGLDTAQFLKFSAAEAAVNQWDMYAYTVFYVNNLRLYNDPETKKFSFIPWGMDMSMKPFRDSRKPYIKLFSLARQADRDAGPVTAGLIFQRCLASPGCKSAYADAVREIIRVYESLDLEKRANAYFAQIKERVQEDKKKNVCCAGGTLSDAQFEAGFQSVLGTLRGRVAALRADLDAN
jgi:hypothetical protein